MLHLLVEMWRGKNHEKKLKNYLEGMTGSAETMSTDCEVKIVTFLLSSAGFGSPLVK